MRLALVVIAAGALLGGAAQAKDNPNALATGKDAVAQQPLQKVLYVCSEDELAWRAFSRDLGTPEFVTADQVRAQRGKAWSAPKCITASELRRLNASMKLTAAK